MNSSLSFSTFEPLREVPEVCSLCGANAPVFAYEAHTYGAGGEPKDTQGFCCARCSVGLLKKLERVESKQWTEEETALQAEDSDISDFHRHRLAAFPAKGQ
jgi:hypothetical protein